MNQCPVCHRMGSLTMCRQCLGDLSRILFTICQLLPELETELRKQTAKVSKMQRSGGSASPLPYSPESSELATNAMAVLKTWVTLSCPWQDTSRLTAIGLARFAYTNIGRLARVQNVTVMFAELVTLRDTLYALVDLGTERVFIGTCTACGYALHADPLLEYQECRCGAQIDVQTAKRVTREAIEDSYLTPAETREYLRKKGAKVTAQQLSNWGREGKVIKQMAENQSFYLLSSVVRYAQERGLLEAT